MAAFAEHLSLSRHVCICLTAVPAHYTLWLSPICRACKIVSLSCYNKVTWCTLLYIYTSMINRHCLFVIVLSCARKQASWLSSRSRNMAVAVPPYNSLIPKSPFNGATRRPRKQSNIPSVRCLKRELDACLTLSEYI